MLTDPIKNYGSIVGTLKQTNEEYNSFIKRQTISRYIKTSYPPDIESKTILEIADFEKAFLYRARKKDMNIVAVMGPQGRGKTNVIKFAMNFSKSLNASFSWGRNLYIGEDTLIHRKHLASRHGFGEQVINDEAEFLNRPNSIQLRDFRNYQNFNVSFHKKLNIIIGQNAQGKTNLVEAIFLSCFGKSFRTNNDRELIMMDKEIAYVSVEIIKEHTDMKVETRFNRSKKKEIRINYLKSP